MVKKRVLIVDDDATLRWMLHETLTGWGYQMLEAGTAAQAVAMAREQPHLVLLDINLPDGSGLELLRQLKVRLPHSPILMLTGESVFENAVTALRGGAADCLSKPLNLGELQEALQRFESQTVQQADTPSSELPRVLILCDTPAVIPSLQAVFGDRDVSLTSVIFPEEWEYIANEPYNLALLSLSPELLEPALKNLRARDQLAATTILVETPDAISPVQFAGVLPQYRAMPCSRAEMAHLAQSRFAASPKSEAAARVL
jgi:CheY-like chemotaxis protein